MFDERDEKTWTRGEGSRGLRDWQFCAGERGIGNFVQEREREGGGRSQSAIVTSPCFQMTPHSLAWYGHRLRSARCPL